MPEFGFRRHRPKAVSLYCLGDYFANIQRVMLSFLTSAFYLRAVHCSSLLSRCTVNGCHLGNKVRRFAKHVAILCLLLTALSALAFASHHHPNGVDSACSVCVVAHSAAPKLAAHLPQVIFAPVAAVQTEAVSVQERFLFLRLSVRPPPAV